MLLKYSLSSAVYRSRSINKLMKEAVLLEGIKKHNRIVRVP